MVEASIKLLLEKVFEFNRDVGVFRKIHWNGRRPQVNWETPEGLRIQWGTARNSDQAFRHFGGKNWIQTLVQFILFKTRNHQSILAVGAANSEAGVANQNAHSGKSSITQLEQQLRLYAESLKQKLEDHEKEMLQFKDQQKK